MPHEHVYLVDDNADIRFHLKSLLVNKGYNVHEFEGAQAFLDLNGGGSSRSRTDLHGFANTGPTPIGYLETKGCITLAPSRAKT
jgi:hypothetical protein